MNLHKKSLPDTLDEILLIGLSDVHVGAREFNEDKFQRWIKWIADTPNAYVILNGDLANVALKDSKSDVYQETMNPNDQKRYLIKALSPLKGKVLGLTEGNHERRIRLSTSIDICQDIADSLECPYEPDGLLLGLSFGKDTAHQRPVHYDLYVTHGWSASRSAGGKVNMAMQLRSVVVADVYITGHTHEKFAHEEAIYIPESTGVSKVKQLLVNSGAWLDYGGYAQAKGYTPGGIGAPRVILNGRRKDVHCSL